MSALATAQWVAAAENPSASPTLPVLVELFTSEGCSTCPPADDLLGKLDRLQPVSGTQVIALSEHVDYWDHDGWKDPHSSPVFTDRQRQYGRRFGLNVYTPQMVIDGASQFNGSDASSASRAFAMARSRPKIGVRISRLWLENPTTLRAHLESEALPQSLRARKADMYVVVALDHAESQVLRGENQGRHMTHVAVAEKVRRVGAVGTQQGFQGEVELKLDAAADPANLRLVAFIQEPDAGEVLGTSMQKLANESGK
jgi:hypothetical protein